MSGQPRLSVVVPTYQRRDSVLRLLASFTRQTFPADAFEIIISVDGSTDGTADAVRAFSAGFTVAALEGSNRGRASACNAGLRAASGDVVVLLDDDMEASPGFLAAHATAHAAADAGGARRAVVGAAPIVVPPDSPPFVRYMADGFRSRLERLAQPGYRLRFRDTYTGNFSAPRDALLAAGGFDESFRVYGHEDYELALRLQAAGVELTYSAEALAYQHYQKTFAGFARDGIARGRTAVLFAAKHPEVVDRLKLSEYGQWPWRWRALRSLLLRLSRVTHRVPDWVVAAVERVERWEPPRLDKYYTMAIDYLYWYGAFAAMREQGAGAPARAENGHDSWVMSRTRVGVALVLLYALASGAGWIKLAASAARRSAPDDITSYEQRFQDLRAALPPRGVVGYLAHPDPAGGTPAERDARSLLHFKRYLLAQYALAPVVLIESTEPDVVVGNFDPGTAPATPEGFRVERDFGSGLVLFRRAP